MPLSSGQEGTTTSRLLNQLQYAVSNVAADITTGAGGDKLLFVDVSDNYAIKYGDADNVIEVLAGAGAGRFVNVTDAATYTILAADSGKIHILPNFTADCTATLPTAAAGLEYTFISKAVAADAQNFILKSPSATNFYLGGVSFADTDAGAGADEIHAGVWSNGSTNDFLTLVTPGAGTRVQVVCDGTNWIVNGQVFSATVPTFSDT